MAKMEDNCNRYLRLLGVDAESPSTEALRRLVLAHMVRVPFENITKLVRWKTAGRCEIPSLAEYLDGIEQNHFGGTCYTNNYYLNQLLVYLGYEVRLCGADMNRPDVHMVSLVSVEGREFLVDVGYAAPFIEPLLRDLSEDFAVALGSDRYVLRPQDAEGRSRMELHRDGTLRHSYVVKPEPKRLADFDQAIAESFRPAATFMNAILIVRFDVDQSYLIHNMELIETHGKSSRRSTFHTIDELVEGIHDIFGMPADIVRRALDGFSFQGDAWS
jgi:N-hydroxyarylamine O-acetyltransferase